MDQRPGTKDQGPRIRNQRPGTKDQRPKTRDQGSGTRDQGPETRDQGPGTRDQGPGSRDQEPATRDQGPETRDQGPETRDQGPGTRDQGPGIRDQGPGIRDQGSDRFRGYHLPRLGCPTLLASCVNLPGWCNKPGYKMCPVRICIRGTISQVTRFEIFPRLPGYMAPVTAQVTNKWAVAILGALAWRLLYGLETKRCTPATLPVQGSS